MILNFKQTKQKTSNVVNIIMKAEDMCNKIPTEIIKEQETNPYIPQYLKMILNYI